MTMTVAVMVPTPCGLDLYVKERGRRMRLSRSVFYLEDFQSWLRYRHERLVLAHAGGDIPRAHLEAALQRADVVHVPQAWLAALPPNATARRARAAAHIALNHLREPIRSYLATEPEPNSNPF